MPMRRRTALALVPAVGDVLAVEQDATAVDRVEQVDAAQQRGLARAARADQAHHLVLGDRRARCRSSTSRSP